MAAENLGVFETGFASWSRILTLSKNDAVRLVNFTNAATEAVTYVGKGLEKVTAVDELYELAFAHGLVAEHGEDVIQQIIADAFEPPKPNGHDGHAADAFAEAQQAWERVEHEAPEPPASFDFINAASFEGQTAPPRRWLVHNRIPMRNVTLLSGDGAVGKTTIALQLAIAVATDALDWLQNVIDERGPVMFLTAEEEMPEIHFRLEQIVDYYPDIQWIDLANLHLKSMADADCVLAVPDRRHILTTTKSYDQLSASIRQIQPKVVIMESAADLFAGNEIDRSQVRKFISLLRELAIKHDCAVILLSHPSVAGMASGSGSAGSTQWNNAVRSRMYFKTVKSGIEDDDVFDNDAEAVKDSGSDYRELQYLKNNRAKYGDKIRLRWTDGLFLPEKQQAPADKAAQDAKADEIFMLLLRKFESDGTGRTAGVKSGTTYAPALFAKEKEARAANVTNAMLAKAMDRLIAGNKIRSIKFGPPSRERYRLMTAKN